MINIVVVGFGFMGFTHAGNIVKNPVAKLTAIADKNPDNIYKKLKEQTGNFVTEGMNEADLSGVNIYNDFSECLVSEKPDACVIAVHTDMHYELARQALEAGVHVFLEKPFCLDVSQGQQLIDLARERNKILMIGHVVRFMPAYQLLKNWIDSKEYGQLEFLSLSRFSGIPVWGQWKDKQKEFGSSGGALFDLVIHDIDFVQWVCGNPDNINAINLPGKLSSYDYITALWNYKETNLNVKIEGGNTFHPEYPFLASFTARFQDASVYYSTKDSENIVVAADSGTSVIKAGNANDGFSGELNYFISCVINNEQPVQCTPESALETIKICYRHINEIN
jgi:predicted dehydrogenase